MCKQPTTLEPTGRVAITPVPEPDSRATSAPRRSMRSPASPQARASNLVKGTVVALSAALIAGSAGCEARVYGSPGHDSQMSVVVPQAPAETEAAAEPADQHLTAGRADAWRRPR